VTIACSQYGGRKIREMDLGLLRAAASRTPGAPASPLKNGCPVPGMSGRACVRGEAACPAIRSPASAHPLRRARRSGEAEPVLLERGHERGRDLVSVPVALPDRARAAVELPERAVVRARLEDGQTQSKPHCPAHVRARELEHLEQGERVRLRGKLDGVRAWLDQCALGSISKGKR
jgi:hypothetical protein